MRAKAKRESESEKERKIEEEKREREREENREGKARARKRGLARTIQREIETKRNRGCTKKQGKESLRKSIDQSFAVSNFSNYMS